MVAVKLVLSIVLALAGLSATVKPLGQNLAYQRIFGNYYHKILIVLTTGFLILVVWSW